MSRLSHSANPVRDAMAELQTSADLAHEMQDFGGDE